MLKIRKLGKYRLVNRPKHSDIVTPYSVKTNVEINDTWVKVFYSALLPYWSAGYKKKMAGKAHDHGTDVIFEIEGTKFQLDYSQVEILYVLLKEYISVQDDL